MTSGSDGLLLEHFPDKRYVDVPGLCGVADLAAIEEQGWSLNPGRFIEFRPPEAMSEEEFAHAVSALQVELLDLDTAAMQLTAAVQEVLRMAAMTLNRGPLRDLIASYVGGGWGRDAYDEVYNEPAYVIRGTDFDSASAGDARGVPFRFHKSSGLRSRRLEPSDLIIEGAGGSIDQPVGRVMLVDEHVLGAFDAAVICASFCKRVTPDSAIDPEYLYWYLLATYTSGLIERYQVQSTGIRNLGVWFPKRPGRGGSMRVTGVIANLPVADIAADRDFYTHYLGLSVEDFNLGWVARYGSPDGNAFVQLATRDATASQDSVISVHVGSDVDEAYEEAKRRGYEIVHPLTEEAWEVRRFFIRAPDGNVINMVSHSGE